MGAAASTIATGGAPPAGALRQTRRVSSESALVRWTLITVALLFLGLFLFLPVVVVFVEAFKDGLGPYFAALADDDTLAAIRLTLTTALIAVPLNVIFGLAAAWAIARFEFPGKSLLVTLIDLPFAVSPVIAGMLFVLLFGAQGALGPWLQANDIKVIFAEPGIILATTFVTFPFVARELIPFLESQGPEEEEAALVLGASGWRMFFRVTLPNAKWGLLYGIVLCNARAMGEFGAVSVVSGHIRGSTNTIPLHVEVLYNEYHFSSAFAVASLLVVLALFTLVAKRFIEGKAKETAALVGKGAEASAADAAPARGGSAARG
jgi:sulfate/thiosulfate transport system permease protein